MSSQDGEPSVKTARNVDEQQNGISKRKNSGSHLPNSTASIVESNFKLMENESALPTTWQKPSVHAKQIELLKDFRQSKPFQEFINSMRDTYTAENVDLLTEIYQKGVSKGCGDISCLFMTIIVHLMGTRSQLLKLEEQDGLEIGLNEKKIDFLMKETTLNDCPVLKVTKKSQTEEVGYSDTYTDSSHSVVSKNKDDRVPTILNPFGAGDNEPVSLALILKFGIKDPYGNIRLTEDVYEILACIELLLLNYEIAAAAVDITNLESIKEFLIWSKIKITYGSGKLRMRFDITSLSTGGKMMSSIECFNLLNNQETKKDINNFIFKDFDTLMHLMWASLTTTSSAKILSAYGIVSTILTHDTDEMLDKGGQKFAAEVLLRKLFSITETVETKYTYLNRVCPFYPKNGDTLEVNNVTIGLIHWDGSQWIGEKFKVNNILTNTTPRDMFPVKALSFSSSFFNGINSNFLVYGFGYEREKYSSPAEDIATISVQVSQNDFDAATAAATAAPTDAPTGTDTGAATATGAPTDTAVILKDMDNFYADNVLLPRFLTKTEDGRHIVQYIPFNSSILRIPALQLNTIIDRMVPIFYKNYIKTGKRPRNGPPLYLKRRSQLSDELKKRKDKNKLSEEYDSLIENINKHIFFHVSTEFKKIMDVLNANEDNQLIEVVNLIDQFNKEDQERLEAAQGLLAFTGRLNVNKEVDAANILKNLKFVATEEEVEKKNAENQGGPAASSVSSNMSSGASSNE